MRLRKHKTALILCSIFAFLIIAHPVYAQLGLEQSAGRAGLYNPKGENTSFVGLAGNIIAAALSMISVVFFVLIIYGGFRWMVARGNDQEIQKAQDTIISSIIGVIVILLAYAITSFVFNSLTGQGLLGGGSGGSNQENKNVSACDAYKEINSEFTCLDSSKCSKSMQTVVTGAYKQKQIGANPKLEPWLITNTCPGGKNIVCCIPKTAQELENL